MNRQQAEHILNAYVEHVFIGYVWEQAHARKRRNDTENGMEVGE